MTGIQYIKNAKGETTHLVADWKEYGKLFEKFLEELEDIKAFDDGMKSDKWYSFEEVRKIGLDKGIPDEKLAK